MKYSQYGNQITVHVQKSNFKQHKESGYQIHVSDEGPGISETDLVHLFKPYYRAKNELNPIQGHGLGLNISKRIAVCLGGDLLPNDKYKNGC